MEKALRIKEDISQRVRSADFSEKLTAIAQKDDESFVKWQMLLSLLSTVTMDVVAQNGFPKAASGVQLYNVQARVRNSFHSLRLPHTKTHVISNSASAFANRPWIRVFVGVLYAGISDGANTSTNVEIFNAHCVRFGLD